MVHVFSVLERFCLFEPVMYLLELRGADATA